MDVCIKLFIHYLNKIIAGNILKFQFNFHGHEILIRFAKSWFSHTVTQYYETLQLAPDTDKLVELNI